MGDHGQHGSRRIAIAAKAFAIVAVIAAPSSASQSAPAIPSDVRGFVLNNVYVAAADGPQACKRLSAGSQEAFLKSLTPEEQARYSKPEQAQQLTDLMDSRLGFKAVNILPGGKGEGPPLTEARLSSLRKEHGIPEGKGAISRGNRRLTYDSCSDPDDFMILDRGHEEYRGPAYGVNLDGKVGKDDPVSPEGDVAVDNQLWRAVGCSFTPREFGEDKTARVRMNSSQEPMLIELRGVDNDVNDPEIEIYIFKSATPVLPNARGFLTPWTSLNADPNPDYISHTRGRISNGVVTSEPFRVRLLMREQVLDYVNDMREARMRFTIAPDGTISGGFYGYLAIDSATAPFLQLTQNGANALRTSCPQVVNAIRRHADAFPDPVTGRNTAISTALNFGGKPAFIFHPGPAAVRAASR